MDTLPVLPDSHRCTPEQTSSFSNAIRPLLGNLIKNLRESEEANDWEFEGSGSPRSKKVNRRAPDNIYRARRNSLGSKEVPDKHTPRTTADVGTAIVSARLDEKSAIPGARTVRRRSGEKKGKQGFARSAASFDVDTRPKQELIGSAGTLHGDTATSAQHREWEELKKGYLLSISKDSGEPIQLPAPDLIFQKVPLLNKLDQHQNKDEVSRNGYVQPGGLPDEWRGSKSDKRHNKEAPIGSAHVGVAPDGTSRREKHNSKVPPIKHGYTQLGASVDEPQGKGAHSKERPSKHASMQNGLVSDGSPRNKFRPQSKDSHSKREKLLSPDSSPHNLGRKQEEERGRGKSSDPTHNGSTSPRAMHQRKLFDEETAMKHKGEKERDRRSNDKVAHVPRSPDTSPCHGEISPRHGGVSAHGPDPSHTKEVTTLPSPHAPITEVLRITKGSSWVPVSNSQFPAPSSQPTSQPNSQSRVAAPRSQFPAPSQSSNSGTSISNPLVVRRRPTIHRNTLQPNRVASVEDYKSSGSTSSDSRAIQRRATMESKPLSAEVDSAPLQAKPDKKHNWLAVCVRFSKKHQVPLRQVEKDVWDFRAMDVDGSGTLSMEEFCTVVEKRCSDSVADPVDFAQREAVNADLDQSGDIDLEEYLLWNHNNAFREDVCGLNERESNLRALAREMDLTIREVEDIRDIFNRFDANSSGIIDRQEFRQVIMDLFKTRNENDVMDARFDRYFKEADVTCSGGIDLQEFIVWYLKYFGTPENEEMPVVNSYSQLGTNRFHQD